MTDPLASARMLRLETIAARGVRAPAPEALDPSWRSSPSAEPIYQTAAFDAPSIDASGGALTGSLPGTGAPDGSYAYARYGTPNSRSLELTVAALEAAEDALATSSGMSAILCAVLASTAKGERVLVQREAYGGTLALAKELTDLGIEMTPADLRTPDGRKRALAAGPRAVLVETVSNPLLHRLDIADLAAACREAGALLLVDNTFLTPALARPLEDGASLVLHSATKFLGGHHDLTCGVLAGDRPRIERARALARRLGVAAPPFDAWLCCRGISTLALRMERASSNARALAVVLRGQRRVARVHDPGIGALLSFSVDGRDAAERVIERLRLITLTPSLGGARTTIIHPATSSHRGLSATEREAVGIGEGLLRLSVGLEAPQDLAADLEQALAR